MSIKRLLYASAIPFALGMVELVALFANEYRVALICMSIAFVLSMVIAFVEAVDLFWQLIVWAATKSRPHDDRDHAPHV